MMSMLERDLKALGNPARARVMSGFFKTGKGEYGEGDVFLGVSVPDQRKIAKKYAGIPYEELEVLLSSEIHEHRLVALLVLAGKYDSDRERVFDFFMKNLSRVNNWDLVDLAAPNILGRHLLGNDNAVLYRLAKSKNLWGRRIAVVSTFSFIRKGMFDDTFKICEILLNDDHDLIHKACGWMLREVGKRDVKALEKFLGKYSKKMPRTMLRYAIERLPEKRKKYFMKRS